LPSQSRILIADDHILIAELCRQLLEPEFSVVGTVGNGRAMVRAASELRPDVIVVDVAMPILNGLDAGRQVKKLNHTIKLIYLTMNPDAELAAEAFRRGASGYLLKTCTSSELLRAVREVIRGSTYLSKNLPADAINNLRREQKGMVEEGARVTKREREVLQLLSEGNSSKQIADILKVKTRTVDFHRYQIKEKLGIRSTAELVRFAIRNYLVGA
jgi:DNA-binding NarL/FixJ family response regulator